MLSFLFGIGIGAARFANGSGVEGKIVKVAIDKCQDLGTGVRYIGCLRREFQTIVAPDNLTAVMHAIELISPHKTISPESSTTGCHELGHVVGELVQASGAPFATLLRSCGRTCGYGCAHGVMAALLRQNPTMINSLGALCDPAHGSVTNRSESIACNHGVGHGLADYAQYDTKNALSLCDEFPRLSAKEECATGVFMELYEAPTQMHPTLPLPETIAYCDGLPTFAKDVCVGSVASVTFNRTQDIQKGFQICGGVTGGVVYKCIQAVGSEVYFVDSGVVDKVVSHCESNEQFTQDCVVGAIVSSLVIDGTGRDGERICDALQVHWQASCRETLKNERASMQGSPQ